MIKDLVKDPLFLSRVSKTAVKDDLDVCQDLRDTLQKYSDHCVGMAANMIGVLKRIIIINDHGQTVVMLNPEIMQTWGHPYEDSEECLCHEGSHRVKRYAKIKVKYQDEQMKIKIKTYQGLTAQIIQHEIDHCNGILV